MEVLKQKSLFVYVLFRYGHGHFDPTRILRRMRKAIVTNIHQPKKCKRLAAGLGVMFGPERRLVNVLCLRKLFISQIKMAMITDNSQSNEAKQLEYRKLFRQLEKWFWYKVRVTRANLKPD